MNLLRKGELVLVDNTMWSGKVADESNQTPSTVAIRTPNKRIHEDSRVEMVILQLADGLTIA